MHDHPHNAAIIHIIKVINKKRIAGHEIALTMDGNKLLVNDKGGIFRIYQECKLYDPLDHRNGDIRNKRNVGQIIIEVDIML